MIDTRLVALVETTEARLGAMEDASRNGRARLREEFVAEFDSILAGAVDSMTPEQKLAAFDALAREHVENLRLNVRRLLDGRDSGMRGPDHMAWENMRIAVLGRLAFEATNAIEDIVAPMPF